jgi:hypothetical protein
MANFSFLNNHGPRVRAGKKAIVNISPWQTAEALAPLAVTAEEKEFARDAQRLADHDVDQAFAAALRQATLQAQHITLSGEALALSQKIAELQELIRQDQELVLVGLADLAGVCQTEAAHGQEGRLSVRVVYWIHVQWRHDGHIGRYLRLAHVLTAFTFASGAISGTVAFFGIGGRGAGFLPGFSTEPRTRDLLQCRIFTFGNASCRS